MVGSMIPNVVPVREVNNPHNVRVVPIRRTGPLPVGVAGAYLRYQLAR